MSRFARACALLITVVLSSVGLAAPATAGDYSVSISTDPVVVAYGACTEVPFPYAVNPPAENESWWISLEVTRPDGTSGGVGVSIGRDAPTTGVGSWSLCPQNDMPGTYSVSGAYYVEMPDGPIFTKTIKTPVAPFTFDVRHAALRATASPSDKKVRPGQKVKVKVQVTDERPGGGFFGTYAASVQLQRLQGKRWVGVKGATGDTSTSGREVLSFNYKWDGKNKFRVRAKDYDLGTVDSNTFALSSRR